MVKPTRVTNSIRALRFANGEMTQADLADRVGVTRQTIIAIEQGKYSPTLEMAFRIARVFQRAARRCLPVLGRARMTSQPPVPAPAGHRNHPHTEMENTMSTSFEKSPSLPPRWFIRLFWVVQRAVYSVTRGRFGLRSATADRWGMLRLQTVGRRSGEERTAILGYFEDGPDLVTMAMNGWADPEPAWWLNLQAHPDATVDLPGGESRAVHGRAADQGRAATPVGHPGHLRQGSRRLCGPAVSRDRGRHPVAPVRVRHQRARADDRGRPAPCRRRSAPSVPGAAAGSEGDRLAHRGAGSGVTVARVVVYITRIVSSPFERAAHGLLKGTHSLDRELLDKAEGQITIVHPCPA